MLSGGEPTVRKDLEELIERLLERNITRIMLNTNGRRIAKDDRLLKFLQHHRERIEVYLQFDGFRPETHVRLRGENVGPEKLTALKRLNEAGIFTTLVATVAKGVNEDEVGSILQLGLDTPKCAGLRHSANVRFWPHSCVRSKRSGDSDRRDPQDVGTDEWIARCVRLHSPAVLTQGLLRHRLPHPDEGWLGVADKSHWARRVEELDSHRGEHDLLRKTLRNSSRSW